MGGEVGHRSLRSEDRAPFLALVNSPLNAGRPYSDLPRGRPSPLLVSLVQSGYTTPRPSIIGGAPGGASSSQFWSQASRIVSFAGLCRVPQLLSWLSFVFCAFAAPLLHVLIPVAQHSKRRSSCPGSSSARKIAWLARADRFRFPTTATMQVVGNPFNRTTFLSFFLSFFATPQNTLEGRFISVARDSVPADVSNRVDDVEAEDRPPPHDLSVPESHPQRYVSRFNYKGLPHRTSGKSAKCALVLGRSKSTLRISLQTGDDYLCNLPTLTSAMLIFWWDLRYDSGVLSWSTDRTRVG